MPATAATVAVAVALVPVIAAVLAGTSWAQRLPGNGQPRLGVIEEPSIIADPVLGRPGAVALKVRVWAPATATAELRLDVGGRSCADRRPLEAGRSVLRLDCAVPVDPADLPALTARASVRLGPALTRGAGTPAAPIRRVTTVVLPIADAPAASSASAGARWRAVDDHLDRAATAVERNPRSGLTGVVRHTSANLSELVRREAQRSGWRSPATRRLLEELLATRKPGGGFGLATAWDAYADGTVNPATTAYTVTTAGHVGGVLLAGYQVGAVSAAQLNATVDALLAMPRLEGGTCLAYSNSPLDEGGPCVYNVSHGAAAFLVRFRATSDYRAAEIDAVVDALRSRLGKGYDPATGYWAYLSGSVAPQDMSHQLYTAQSVDVVDPGFGAVARMMARPWWQHPGGLDQARLPVAASMLELAAANCAYARAPGVIMAVERGLHEPAPPFTLLAMATTADEVRQRCFAPPTGT